MHQTFLSNKISWDTMVSGWWAIQTYATFEKRLYPLPSLNPFNIVLVRPGSCNLQKVCRQAACDLLSSSLMSDAFARLVAAWPCTCSHQHDDRLAASCCQRSCRKLSLTDLLQFTPTDLLQCRVQAFKVWKIWCTPMQTSNFCCFPDPNTTSWRDYQSTLCMLGFLH